MEIMKLRSKPKKKTINKKVITGAVLATTATAAGTVMASTRGREMVKKVMDRQDTESGSPDMLGNWIKDAYAMEAAQIIMLKGIKKDFKGDKEISDKIERHLKQTESHKKDMEKCLEIIGEKPSKSKEIIGRVAGIGPAIDTKLFKDKKVKNMLMMHSGEHFEHASYLALSTAAEAMGKKNIATTANRIAKEELEMAGWAEKMLPGVIKQHLPS